jgi:hypothetical protein
VTGGNEDPEAIVEHKENGFIEEPGSEDKRRDQISNIVSWAADLYCSYNRGIPQPIGPTPADTPAPRRQPDPRMGVVSCMVYIRFVPIEGDQNEILISFLSSKNYDTLSSYSPGPY